MTLSTTSEEIEMDEILLLSSAEPDGDVYDDAPLSALSLVACADAFFG